MTNDFLRPPSLRPRIVAAGAVAVGVSALVGLLLNDPSRSAAQMSPPPAAAVPDRTELLIEPTAEPSGTTTAVGPVVLVRGAQLVNGVAMGYPHSEVGAVSAAVEYSSQICSTLDPDRAAAIGRLVSDGTSGVRPEDLAQGRANIRRWIGLPPTGQLPATASIVFGPVAFQLREPSTDRMIVLMLAYVTSNTPQQGMVTRLGVFPVVVVWRDDDWRIGSLAGVPEYATADLLVQPGSAQAAALGWREITR
jgi:hypothetical protein